MACMGSLLFKMGKERGGEMEKNVPRSAVTAWGGLDIVVHGELCPPGRTLDELENANMATFGVEPYRSLVPGTFRPERQRRPPPASPHRAHFTSFGLRYLEIFFFWRLGPRVCTSPPQLSAGEGKVTPEVTSRRERATPGHMPQNAFYTAQHEGRERGMGLGRERVGENRLWKDFYSGCRPRWQECEARVTV